MVIAVRSEEQQDQHEAIRAAVREICKDYPDAYWRELDNKQEYPDAFVRALT